MIWELGLGIFRCKAETHLMEFQFHYLIFSLEEIENRCLWRDTQFFLKFLEEEVLGDPCVDEVRVALRHPCQFEATFMGIPAAEERPLISRFPRNFCVALHAQNVQRLPKNNVVLGLFGGMRYILNFSGSLFN